jgi:hypothetical protein
LLECALPGGFRQVSTQAFFNLKLQTTKPMKTYLWLAQRVFALSAFVASGQGTLFVYDQQSATSRDLGIGGVSIQQMQPMGQSFIPGLSSVGFVQFEFTDFNPGNGLGATVYVNLLADSISGTVLDSTAPVFMPDGVFASVTSFLFATPAAVAPGTTYYLQPIVQSGDHWDVVGGNYGYAGGTLYALGAPSGSGTDLWFREGVIIPEPPSGSLVLLGIAGICAFRWVRRFRAGKGSTHSMVCVPAQERTMLWVDPFLRPSHRWHGGLHRFRLRRYE